MVAAGGAGARNFAGGERSGGHQAAGRQLLDHLHLCGDNRSAHCLQQFLTGGGAEVEAAGVLFAGAVLAAECLLALTGKVCKRQTSATALCLTTGLLLRSDSGSRSRHLKRSVAWRQRQPTDQFFP